MGARLIDGGRVVRSVEAEVEAAAGGCELARERLARRYLPIVRGWAVGMVAAQDVDDLVQSTLVAMLAAIPRWSAWGSWDAYVFGIARNLGAKLNADRRREGARWCSEAVDEVAALPDPLEERQLLELTVMLLVRLPEWQRDAVELAGAGASTREAAEAMPCGYHTARSRLARARVALRCLLRESGVDLPDAKRAPAG